jgi:hypothetical protein
MEAGSPSIYVASSAADTLIDGWYAEADTFGGANPPLQFETVSGLTVKNVYANVHSSTAFAGPANGSAALSNSSFKDIFITNLPSTPAVVLNNVTGQTGNRAERVEGATSLHTTGSNIGAWIGEDASGNWTLPGITNAPIPYFTTSVLAGATEGVAYSQAISFAGGTSGYTLSCPSTCGLPSGLSVSGNSITGTPAGGDAAGSPYSVVLNVIDAALNSSNKLFSLNVGLGSLYYGYGCNGTSTNTCTVGSLMSGNLASYVLFYVPFTTGSDASGYTAKAIGANWAQYNISSDTWIAGIYTGTPGGTFTLVSGCSATATAIGALGWQELALSGCTLAKSTAYYIGYSASNAADELYYNGASGLTGAYAANAYTGTLPSSIATTNGGGNTLSGYVRVTAN